MRVLLLAGTTAREHAIAEALSRSRRAPEIFALCASPNPGIQAIAARQELVNILDLDRVTSLAREVRPDFAIIGPDDPIGLGAADALASIGIPSVAPTKSLARIESSKGFTRDLMAKYGINASPQFRVFSRKDRTAPPADEQRALYAFMADILRGEFVVKYDALKGGKGVKLSGEHLADVDEGVAYAVECLDECGQVVIEEKLVGVEFSLLSFVSGTQVVDMPAVQDHKRAYQDDTGPNTGGMGTYSDANHSLPFLAPSDLARAKELNRLVAQALLRECGEPYRGILYGGFIAVKDGIRVIEYNARFGDPEALNILPLLTSDFVDVCLGILQGELQDSLVSFAHKATVCKYVTAASYPESKKEKGLPFTIPERIPADARLFFGDATKDDSGAFRLGGSRAVGVVGIGNSLADAERSAQSVCDAFGGPVRCRKDIGTAALVQRRVDTMRQLRGN